MNESVQAALILTLLFGVAYVMSYLTHVGSKFKHVDKEENALPAPPKTNIGLVRLNVCGPPCAACGYRLPTENGAILIQRWDAVQLPQQYHPECVILLSDDAGVPTRLDGTPFAGGEPPKGWEGWLVECEGGTCSGSEVHRRAEAAEKRVAELEKELGTLRRARCAAGLGGDPWWGVWAMREGYPGHWHSAVNTAATPHLQTTRTEAERVSAALNEFSAERTDSVGWRYEARPYAAGLGKEKGE